jgi:hypothetical protein
MILRATFLVFVCLLADVFGRAQNQVGPITPVKLSPEEINRIIKSFTEKEKEFREALKKYVFNRSVTIQTIGLGGNVTGTYRRDSFITFTENGERYEKIIYAPVSTLKDISVTPEDIEDLGGVNPFALEPEVVHLYNFTLVGKQRIDELDLYVFDVVPKVMPNPKKWKQRLFVGRIWIDDRDLQIVKSKGKGVPETKNNKFPVVETWRENVDGKYWFPAYSYSDEELVFDNGMVVRIRMHVRYSNYRIGRSEIRILEDEEVSPPEQKKP